ncbi:MAG TPA: DUF2934 domain-containing protein [Steroidobacteraceae bacterium]|jgi:hypothetical protein|nr:DUF2934 domain-containing protein [Steroidobacteraceae bacterium]
MNVQEQKSPRRARRQAATAASGAVANARQDADIAQLTAAEAEARAADHEVKVALAAYFIAEKRGFEPGHELEDWLAAEAEIAKAESPSVLTSIQLSPVESAS